jgi:hypothetical protein
MEYELFSHIDFCALLENIRADRSHVKYFPLTFLDFSLAYFKVVDVSCFSQL